MYLYTICLWDYALIEGASQAILQLSMDDPDALESSKAGKPTEWVLFSIQSVIGMQPEGSGLSGLQVCHLLLTIHNRLDKAMHTRHKGGPLAATLALVEILGTEVCDDAVFR